MSIFIASMFRAVSFRVSPLLTLLAAVEKLTTSAESDARQARTISWSVWSFQKTVDNRFPLKRRNLLYWTIEDLAE